MTITLKDNMLHLGTEDDMNHFLHAGYNIYDVHGRKLRYTDRWEVYLKLIGEWVKKENVTQGAFVSLKDSLNLIKNNNWDTDIVFGVVAAVGDSESWLRAEKVTLYYLKHETVYPTPLSTLVIQ